MLHHRAVVVRLRAEHDAAARAFAAVLVFGHGRGTHRVRREARFGRAHLRPADGLARVLAVRLCQLAVGAPAAVLEVTLQVVHHALLVALVEQHARAGAALGDGLRLLLQHGDGRALLEGAQRGGHAARSRAYHHDVERLLFGDVGDGLDDDGRFLEVARLEPFGKARCRLFDFGVGSGRRAACKPCARGDDAGCERPLQKVSTIQFHCSLSFP